LLGSRLLVILLLAAICAAERQRTANQTQAVRPQAAPYQAPALPKLMVETTGDLRSVIERYAADEESLLSFHDIAVSAAALNRKQQFYAAWRKAIDGLPFDPLGIEARIDYVLFANKLDHQLRQIDLTRKRVAEMASLLPFASTIIELKEARQRVDPLDAQQAATTLFQLDKQLDELIRWVDAPDPDRLKIKPSVALRAFRTVGSLREDLKQWHAFYNTYDPLFSWWTAEPFKKLDASLERYAGLVREKLAGLKSEDKDTIIGDPIGSEALKSELAAEMISYTPEQLVEIANKEFAWCEAEMLKASRELGYGDDWKRALEHVKTLHVPPGQQPALILQQALEAVDFVEKHDLVTVPALARDTWRMNMMSPERQRINPFFLGGESITVSFPTDSMTHEQKLMSMRGNNIHFSRATVHHELIPGHNLQRFMGLRYRPYRRVFRTPFWGEGWALYWEMLLWDLKFPETPENRIGMLFWRMHRCARIIFSLNFHLEKMTAQECVDILVNRVGHERENAAAEVRRSFETDYAPLYQSAYMLGGLQFRSLHKDLVKSGKMTNRAFHDAILKMNSIPVEMVRASLLQQKISKAYTPNWKFYGEI
jgi:hypothetical protein